MGFLQWLGGKPKGAPRFVFGESGELSSAELGAMYVNSALPSVDILLNLLFGKNNPGCRLPLVRPVLSDPMPARLYLIALTVASGFIHATKHLGVVGVVLQDIMSGATAELSKLRKPDGKLISPDDVSEVNSLIGAFYDFLNEDFSRDFSVKPDSPHADAPKATQLVLSLIVMRYNNGGPSGEAAVAKLKAQGYYAQAYADATHIIDEAPKTPLRTLQKLNIKFMPA